MSGWETYKSITVAAGYGKKKGRMGMKTRQVAWLPWIMFHLVQNALKTCLFVTDTRMEVVLEMSTGAEGRELKEISKTVGCLGTGCRHRLLSNH